MTMRKRRGGQPGNHNAVKHGYYARNLPPDHPHLVERARRLEGVDEELVMLRVKFRGLLAAQDTELQLILKTVHAIVHLVKIKRGLASIGRVPRVPLLPVDASLVDSFLHILQTKTVAKIDEHESHGETPA
ncbi:MAG: hypothetical protein EXR47_07280 [Dehalococcoidia bacterium]|nr:hypothetical protein [Dehalococcoidia bacterium]